MRRLAPAEIKFIKQELWDVGVTTVSNLLNAEEVARLERELEVCRGKKDAMLLDYGTGGQVINGFFVWRTSLWLTNFTHSTYLPHLAAEVLSSRKINLFSDNIFFKGPDTPAHPSPWHNDQINWIVSGSQVATVWIALDHVTRSTGAMMFARGSHKWIYPDGDHCARPGGEVHGTGDLCASLRDDEVVCHELRPGDATIHLGSTLHAAGGNCSHSRWRRGYAIRYSGDDVVYQPNSSFQTPVPVDLDAGAPLDSPLFPIVFLAQKTLQLEKPGPLPD